MTKTELSKTIHDLNQLTKRGALYIKTWDTYEWIVDIIQDSYGIVILSKQSIMQTQSEGYDSRIYTIDEFENLITNHYTKENSDTVFERYVISTNIKYQEL